jgi:hypothetical protein
MDVRDEIASAIEEITPAPTIVIDDASHASHHQQNAFLEIFPRLESGGLYVIEDLRWQPDTYEKPGITKTAALFRSWLDEREFQHSDPAVAAEFNALSEKVSASMSLIFRRGLHRRLRRPSEHPSCWGMISA